MNYFTTITILTCVLFVLLYLVYIKKISITTHNNANVIATYMIDLKRRVIVIVVQEMEYHILCGHNTEILLHKRKLSAEEISEMTKQVSQNNTTSPLHDNVQKIMNYIKGYYKK